MFLFIALLVVSSFAAAPNKPAWPLDFSTTVSVNIEGKPYPDFLRWFYSSAKDVDRLDGLQDFAGEIVFAERYFNHKSQREYALFFTAGGAVECVDRAITNPLPKPQFRNFTYAGTALIDYVPVYQWFERVKTPQGEDFLQYFETQNDRTPARFIFLSTGKPAIQIDYFEWDSAGQAARIFEIPTEIKASCNAVKKATLKK